MQTIGFYRGSYQSGAMTGVAAGTSTAGHVFAFRWSDATKLALVQALRVRWQTTTAFTTPQELTFRAFRLTSYSASHTGGTAGTAVPRRTSYGASAIGDIRIGNTGALTAGTQTLDTDAFATFLGFSQLGASPFMPLVDAVWSEPDAPLILAQNEGFIIRNEIAQGAAGIGRFVVDVSWQEANP